MMVVEFWCPVCRWYKPSLFLSGLWIGLPCSMARESESEMRTKFLTGSLSKVLSI